VFNWLCLGQKYGSWNTGGGAKSALGNECVWYQCFSSVLIISLRWLTEDRTFYDHYEALHCQPATIGREYWWANRLCFFTGPGGRLSLDSTGFRPSFCREQSLAKRRRMWWCTQWILSTKQNKKPKYFLASQPVFYERNTHFYVNWRMMKFAIFWLRDTGAYLSRWRTSVWAYFVFFENSHLSSWVCATDVSIERFYNQRYSGNK
jgi:hypothetical protein